MNIGIRMNSKLVLVGALAAGVVITAAVTASFAGGNGDVQGASVDGGTEGGQTTGGTGNGQTGGGTENGGGDELDLSAIDACSLVDEATVQQLTGESVAFANQDLSDINAASCFWGAAVAGVGAYLEVSVNRLGAMDIGFTECSMTTVDGVGEEALGASCPPQGESSQEKFYLRARQNGIFVTVLVNDPARPLAPQDLGPTVESVLDEIG